MFWFLIYPSFWLKGYCENIKAKAVFFIITGVLGKIVNSLFFSVQISVATPYKWYLHIHDELHFFPYHFSNLDQKNQDSFVSPRTLPLARISKCFSAKVY